jgi:inosine-uridine nucleoside N-ribohydrolase
MARKIIIDCDPGIDDAFTLALALFDPRLEVVAVTAVEGNVPAEQATQNVQTCIEQLDPPKYPRVGAASTSDAGSPNDARHVHGNDGLGNADFAVASLVRQHPSEKIICEEIRQAPGEVSILCLGPLTNIARAFAREPGIIGDLDRLIIMGGAVNGVGNVTSCAEFNIHCDPVSAKKVFRSASTKTIVPLDVTRAVRFGYDFLQKVPGPSSRAGAFLQKILPHLFRVYRQQVGLEHACIHDVIALMQFLHPELFEVKEYEADVETEGTLTTGMTIFDRRPQKPAHSNTEVAMQVNADGVLEAILKGLGQAEKATS